MQDVLQLEVALWDAWTSLTFQASEAEKRAYDSALTRHEKRNKYRRPAVKKTPPDELKQRKAHQDQDVGCFPARKYRCPIAYCVRSRPFAQLSGVFNHSYVLPIGLDILTELYIVMTHTSPAFPRASGPSLRIWMTMDSWYRTRQLCSLLHLMHPLSRLSA